jgi:hypothetical protein
MAPEPRFASFGRPFLITLLALVAFAPSAHALRVIDWNLLNYPGNSGPTRDPLYRTVLGTLAPDIIVTEETNTLAGVNEFRDNVLNTLEPGQWGSFSFAYDGNDTDCGCFYRISRVDTLGQWAFYPNPANNLRFVHVFRVRPVGYSSDAAEIRFYAFHLKASMGFESQRLAEATGIRDSMNAMPPGTHAFALGDFNFYKSTAAEPGYAKFMESQTSNIGQLYDPLGLGNIQWEDNASIAIFDTQSPCKAGGTACASGASTGGMDDRFDLILPTLNWNDGQGLELLPSTYIAVGNDGQHLNKNITDAPTIPEGAAYADALIHTSDHLPVRVDLQLPAIISVDTTPIVFPTVIIGATLPQQNLSVGDVATPPAEALNYSFTGSTGFQVPGGPFSAAAGGSNLHVIKMGTGIEGNKVGTATISSNDLDHPTEVIDLSGTVLRHAVASLDSIDPGVQSGTIDFGTQVQGNFSNQLARVHNTGYDGLQARLSVTGGTITGGDDRFSIVGGFNPSLVSGTAERYELAFDDTGATPDSTYDATLTFTSEDEPLPGAVAHNDLVITLHARLYGGPLAVGHTAPPAFSRLYPPVPNPLSFASSIHFDLANGGLTRLEVFDLSGRRVADLEDRDLSPGRYDVRWAGRDDRGGFAGAGLYFVRLTAPGMKAQTARLAVVR